MPDKPEARWEIMPSAIDEYGLYPKETIVPQNESNDPPELTRPTGHWLPPAIANYLRPLTDWAESITDAEDDGPWDASMALDHVVRELRALLESGA